VLARRSPASCTPPFADAASLAQGLIASLSTSVDKHDPCMASHSPRTAAINPPAPRGLPSCVPASTRGSRHPRHRGSRRGYGRRGYPGSCG